MCHVVCFLACSLCLSQFHLPHLSLHAFISMFSPFSLSCHFQSHLRGIFIISFLHSTQYHSNNKKKNNLLSVFSLVLCTKDYQRANHTTRKQASANGGYMQTGTKHFSVPPHTSFLFFPPSLPDVFLSPLPPSTSVYLHHFFTSFSFYFSSLLANLRSKLISSDLPGCFP